MHRIREHDSGYTSFCHIPIRKDGEDRALDRDGYCTATNASGKAKHVHRRAYEDVHGPIPEGMVADHLCGNRACCNVAHLQPVLPRENVRRSRNTKLTQQQVDRIKDLRSRGLGPSEISTMFGVSPSHVSNLCSERYWRNDGSPSYRTIKLRQAKACAGQ